MRVLVAMSGGVDSSVAAARLLAEGSRRDRRHPQAVGRRSDSGCCSVADVEDARRVAAQLGIPHYTFNFADDFDATVVGPYVDAHAAGLTPNPCVECNRSIKFGRLLERRRRRASTPSPPGTTPGSSPRRRATSSPGARTRPRTSRTSSTCSAERELGPLRLPGGGDDEGRGAGRGRRPRPPDGREGGEHGGLLHHPGRAGAVPRPTGA